jgi:hypothetical protein
MKTYVEYYNRSRTHLALRKDSPFLNGLSAMALFCPSHSRRTASSILQNLILRGTTIYHFIECGIFPDTPPIAIVHSVPEFIWGMSGEKIVVDASLAAALCGDRGGGGFARHSRRNAGLSASRQRDRSLHPGRDATV